MRRRLRLAAEGIPPVCGKGSLCICIVRNRPGRLASWFSAHAGRHRPHRAFGVGTHRALERRLRDGITVFTPEAGAAVVAVPVTVEGTLVGASDGLVALVEHGADSPVAFSVGQDARSSAVRNPFLSNRFAPGISCV